MRIVKLSDVCVSMFAGGDVDKNNLSYEKTDDFPIPIYTNGKKNDGLYGYTNIAKVEKKAVTVSARGTIGYTCLRNEPFYPAVRLICIIPDEKIISAEYLKCFIESKNYGGQGSGVQQLTIPMLKKELVKIPDLNSQKKIVDKISKLSRVIEIKEQEYQNLNELIFSTYIKMFGSIKNNEKYKYVKIGDLLNKKIDKLKKIYAENSEFNYVDISSIDKENHEIVYTTKHFVGKHPSRAQQCLKSGDIVLSTVRPNLKNVAINYIDDNRVGTSGFCVLRVVESKCTKEYLMTILMSDTFTNDMVGKTTGSNYPAIKCDDIYNYLVPCPDINEQKKYSIFYENVRKQKNIIKQEISKLKEMRDKEYYYSFEC